MERSEGATDDTCRESHERRLYRLIGCNQLAFDKGKGDFKSLWRGGGASKNGH